MSPSTAKRWLKEAGIEQRAEVKRGPEPMQCPISADELGRRYAATTVRELAESLGVSPSMAKRWLKEAGIDKRPGGGPGPRKSGGPRRRKQCPISAEELRRRYAVQSIKTLATSLGASRRKVREWLAEGAVVVAPRGRVGGKEGIDMASLIARYEGGEGLVSLSRAFGRDAGTLGRWLRDAGVKMRGRGRPKAAGRTGIRPGVME
ncbi:helix-turn-helix domain-containing protein [Nonomuraea sp. NPDC050451]|uniref:helix-turn-helix domain-containing protein n=1 Tax=Nonomuraea sp. NPDC050451 TaxID=3364364 RepID=UPI0037A1FF8F